MQNDFRAMSDKYIQKVTQEAYFERQRQRELEEQRQKESNR